MADGQPTGDFESINVKVSLSRLQDQGNLGPFVIDGIAEMMNTKTALRRLLIHGPLFLAMIVSGCGLSGGGKSEFEKYQQKENGFIQAVSAAGGKAAKETHTMFGVSKMGWVIDLSGAQITDALIAQIIEAAKFDPIFGMNFSNSKLTNAQLAKLDAGKALERTVQLDLSETAITSEGLDRLSDLLWISVLNLKGSKVTKESGEKLGERKMANPNTPPVFKTQVEIQI